MSFTMAWNNPPSAPHSFSTDSMVSKHKQKSSQKDENQMKYPSVVAFSNIGNGDLVFVHSPFLVPCYNNVEAAAQRMRCLKAHSQQLAERTDKKKCAARWHRELVLAPPPLLASRRHGRDGAGSRFGRVNYSRTTWGEHALWLLMIGALTQITERSQLWCRGEEEEGKEEE